MKETKTKKSTYLRNFIIAVTLSAAILAAGALWVLLGWRSALDITLTRPGRRPRRPARLHDARPEATSTPPTPTGTCTTATWTPALPLIPDESDDRYRYSAWGSSYSTFYAVTPETRDEVNAAAQRVQVYDDNWQMQKHRVPLPRDGRNQHGQRCSPPWPCGMWCWMRPSR